LRKTAASAIYPPSNRPAMLATLVLVGRPNVGKSTLFNRLDADPRGARCRLPGLTRDRHYGRGRVR